MLSHVCSYLALVASLSSLVAGNSKIQKRDPDCPCGYYDTQLKAVFTESIIINFNETINSITEFDIQVYTHNYEKSWNAIYHQGAATEKVRLNSTSQFLEMQVLPPTKDHVVVGGSVQTLRRDIQYGTFRSLLRPAPPGTDTGGTSLSMMLHYNGTQSISMDIMNTQDTSTAWTSTLLGDEVPALNVATNFSILADAPVKKINPWDATEYRIDWKPRAVNWYIGGAHRRVASKSYANFPSAPGPISITHFSIGNPLTTQGPPAANSVSLILRDKFFYFFV
jgi:hypothetical protein